MVFSRTFYDSYGKAALQRIAQMTDEETGASL